jgi:hypothetical protein
LSNFQTKNEEHDNECMEYSLDQGYDDVQVHDTPDSQEESGVGQQQEEQVEEQVGAQVGEQVEQQVEQQVMKRVV